MKYQLTNKMVKYLDSSKNCPTSLELSRTAFSTRAATSLSALDSQAADTFAAINLNLLSAIYKLLLIPITLVYKINKNSFEFHSIFKVFKFLQLGKFVIYY